MAYAGRLTTALTCHSERSEESGWGRLAHPVTPREGKQTSTTERRLTPLYNSDLTPNPSLGRGFCRAIYRAPCGAWLASFRVPWWGVVTWFVILSGTQWSEESGWGQYTTTLSLRGAAGDVGVSQSGSTHTRQSAMLTVRTHNPTHNNKSPRVLSASGRSKDSSPANPPNLPLIPAPSAATALLQIPLQQQWHYITRSSLISTIPALSLNA